jgi:hypothetical protein
VKTLQPKERGHAALCPCGKPRTGWISNVPTCDDCVDKDRIAHEGLRKWHAFHLQKYRED